MRGFEYLCKQRIAAYKTLSTVWDLLRRLGLYRSVPEPKYRITSLIMRIPQVFRPILAGANMRDRLLACVGVVLSLGLTGALCSVAFGRDPHLPLLVAPVGASAVLLFAVPASPLAQPWPIVGGNVISAIVGILVGFAVQDQLLASGLAVALAIVAMSLTRCLHPPGGAAALTAVLAGPSIAQAGYMFPLVPVGVNSMVLVVLGWLFHRFSRHAYPHVPRPAPASSLTLPPELRASFQPEDVDAALVDLGETFDINRDDLDALLRRVELRAMSRTRDNPTCADIMSKDVVTTSPDATRQAARRLLLQHGLRTLPVVDVAGTLLGTVGLRELAGSSPTVGDVMSKPVTAPSNISAIDIINDLTDGTTHAVVITGPEGEVQGLVTQTDLLAAFSRPLRVTAG